LNAGWIRLNYLGSYTQYSCSSREFSSHLSQASLDIEFVTSTFPSSAETCQNKLDTEPHAVDFTTPRMSLEGLKKQCLSKLGYWSRRLVELMLLVVILTEDASKCM
jgi:hypothetical protein